METLILSGDTFEEFRQLQIRRRWDWPAVFSTNEYGHIWPFVTFGRTQFDERVDVRGISRVIDTVANLYLALREGGGRFFINGDGAFYKDGEKQVWQFIRFEVTEKAAAA